MDVSNCDWISFFYEWILKLSYIIIHISAWKYGDVEILFDFKQGPRVFEHNFVCVKTKNFMGAIYVYSLLTYLIDSLKSHVTR